MKFFPVILLLLLLGSCQSCIGQFRPLTESGKRFLDNNYQGKLSNGDYKKFGEQLPIVLIDKIKKNEFQGSKELLNDFLVSHLQQDIKKSSGSMFAARQMLADYLSKNTILVNGQSIPLSQLPPDRLPVEHQRAIANLMKLALKPDPKEKTLPENFLSSPANMIMELRVYQLYDLFTRQVLSLLLADLPLQPWVVPALIEFRKNIVEPNLHQIREQCVALLIQEKQIAPVQ